MLPYRCISCARFRANGGVRTIHGKIVKVLFGVADDVDIEQQFAAVLARD